MTDEARSNAARGRRTTAPYGSWASPITARLIAESGIALGWLQAAAGAALLARAAAARGRAVACSCGAPRTATSSTSSRRGATCARWCTSTAAASTRCTPRRTAASPRLQRVRRPAAVPAGSGRGRRGGAQPRARPAPITPGPPQPRSLRYADGRVTPDGRTLVCVRERHEDGRGRQRARRAADRRLGGAARRGRRPRLLRGAAPQPRRAAPRLAQLGPPADAVGRHGAVGGGADGRRRARRGAARRRRPRRERPAAGLEPGRPAALRQRPQRLVEPVPGRTPDDARRGGAHRHALAPLAAEFAEPAWVFGLQNYDFLPDGRIVAAFSRDGVEHLGLIDPARPAASSPLPCELHHVLVAGRARRRRSRPSAAARAGRRGRARRPRRAAPCTRSGAADRRRRPRLPSAPEPIEFPTSYPAGSIVAGPLAARRAGARRARAASPPTPCTTRRRTATSRRRRASGRRSSSSATAARPRPPTSSSALAIQFWTSRGIGVVDVELRRLHRLRPRLPRAPARQLGHRRHGGLHQRRALPGRARRRRPGAPGRPRAAAPAATRR